MKATVVFYPHQQKKGTRNDCIPVYMRITYQRQKTEARLFVEIPDSKLSLWDPITMRLLERNSPVNHYLNRLFFKRFKELFKQMLLL
jgi:hypothetical protein